MNRKRYTSPAIQVLTILYEKDIMEDFGLAVSGAEEGNPEKGEELD